jgi:hypothetical protein
MSDMDYRSPESVPLLTDAAGGQQQRQKAEIKRSKLLTVCPFILGRLLALVVNISIIMCCSTELVSYIRACGSGLQHQLIQLVCSILSLLDSIHCI